MIVVEIPTQTEDGFFDAFAASGDQGEGFIHGLLDAIPGYSDAFCTTPRQVRLRKLQPKGLPSRNQ